MTTEIVNKEPLESDPSYAGATFELVSEFDPAGDQPRAIEELVEGRSSSMRVPDSGH